MLELCVLLFEAADSCGLTLDVNISDLVGQFFRLA
jgi:hypothetical protein